LGQKEAATYLLDLGADVDAKSDKGFTPLSNSAREGHLPLVRLREGSTPLTMASNNGHLEVVKLQVEKGAVVDQPCKDDRVTASPLHQAALMGCGAVTTDIPMKKCAGCEIVFYCCEEYQTKDLMRTATRSNARDVGFR
jgi:ankyrin repeat protein